MDRLEQSSIRAEEASRILNSEMFGQAFADTRQALMNTWAALDTTDERYAEFAKDLHRKIKCLDSVRRCLEVHIDTGKLAAKEIDGREKRRVFGLMRA
jgi:hypothetical protein